MKIVIVDDDIFYREKVEKTIFRFFDSKQQMISVDLLGSGYQLLASLETHVLYDVYLLDIDMPQINGLDLAEKIRHQDKTGYIIFITNYEKFALQGYKYQAYRYILKNQYKCQLIEALEQIYEEMENRNNLYYIIQTNFRYEKLLIRDILYLEKEGKYIIFHCSSADYKERTTIEQVYGRLPQAQFIFIERGQVVNLEYVTKLSLQQIELNYDKILYVSRNMLSDVRHKLARYWSGRK